MQKMTKEERINLIKKEKGEVKKKKKNCKTSP